MKKIITNNLIILLVILGAGTIIPVEETEALTISPPKFEVNGGPGSVINQTLKLYNETDESAVFFPEVQNFKARGESGEPGFEDNNNGFSLAGWVEIPKEPIILKAKERKEIPFKINIPRDAEPGGHYAGVLFSTQSPEEQKAEAASIGISGKLGSLIMLRVGGEVEEAGRLLEFDTIGGEKFFSRLPVEFYIRFENQGNVHLKPQGEIKIKGIFDITSTPASLEVNKIKGNVLPDSVRRFESAWSKNGKVSAAEKEDSGFLGELKNEYRNFALGKYRADLILFYGDEQKEVGKSLDFWVVPWRLLTCLTIGLLISIIILKFGVKRYNKWVVRKAGRGV